jgi:hypothetical protein
MPTLSLPRGIPALATLSVTVRIQSPQSFSPSLEFWHNVSFSIKLG